MDLIASQIEFYDRLANDYDPQVGASRIAGEHKYRRLLPAECRYGRALDIGCGTGNWTRGLLDVCDSVLAIDSSREMLDLCRAKLGQSGIEYQLLNVFDYPSLGQFDLIFSTFWVSHVPPERQHSFGPGLLEWSDPMARS